MNIMTARWEYILDPLTMMYCQPKILYIRIDGVSISFYSIVFEECPSADDLIKDSMLEKLRKRKSYVIDRIRKELPEDMKMQLCDELLSPNLGERMREMYREIVI